MKFSIIDIPLKNKIPDDNLREDDEFQKTLTEYRSDFKSCNSIISNYATSESKVLSNQKQNKRHFVTQLILRNANDFQIVLECATSWFRIASNT